jgi:simple sugar transport system substrate-binding protein
MLKSPGVSPAPAEPNGGEAKNNAKIAPALARALALARSVLIASPADAKTYYWISHGSPADPVWTYFLAGAEQWATDTGNTVNTSFHNGDVASHQEAVRAAIAAGADGITTTSPDPGSLVEVAAEANAAGIPIINFNTPDPTASFDAYVGGDNVVFGRNWAQYLVDKGLVKQGDFVWLPVEVAGATYGVQEEEGIKSVFEPLGITWEVTDNTLDQAEVITRMSDYLTANRDKVKAIIGLGDLVTGSIKRVFDQVGVAAGDIPVVGWGNSLDTTQEVLTGYVNAAQWQDPQATSYVALSMAAMEAGGIPAGFNVITGALYEKDQAQLYDDILSGK